ncbi:MAG: hypothetical protein WA364_25480 [Candidatus Nitrosopolaris sp.]
MPGKRLMNELNNTKEGPDRNDEFKDVGRIKLNRKKQKELIHALSVWNLTDMLESLQSQVKQLQETTTRLRKRRLLQSGRQYKKDKKKTKHEEQEKMKFG